MANLLEMAKKLDIESNNKIKKENTNNTNVRSSKRRTWLEDEVIEQLFSYLVRDINNYVMRQTNEYAGHFAAGQKENLFAIIKEPNIDFEREESILVDYVFSLDGVYGSTHDADIHD